MKHSPLRPLAPWLIAAALVGLSGCKPEAAPAANAAATGADTTAAQPDRLALIPAPATLNTLSGEFRVQASTPVYAKDDAAGRVASLFTGFLGKSHGLALQPAAGGGAAQGGIRFEIDPAAKGDSPEAYVLDVTPDGVRVTAREERGLFYGAVTLWQLLTPAQGDVVTLPAVHVEDAPRFGWRGLMIDSARHFQSVDQIKQILDAMALHKLNTFHWHLTDDQGWRMQIRKYPKLTEVGGCRIPAGDGGRDPATGKPHPYCGFYTQDEIRDVVKYAAERHIDIVPEFDVPGHAQAAIAAYPELGVLGDKPAVSNEWGVNTYLFNNDESTMRFFEDVLTEVVELFPGRYVHLGGDEAVKDQWEGSPRVQARMRELGAKNEMAMQLLMVERLEKFLEAHQRRLIGWDEILEGELPPEATVMSWRGIEGGIQAAERGHDVVMTPVSDLYLDYLQTASPNEPPGRPSLIPLKQVYAFEPVPEKLDATKRKHILGLQANVWTEHMRSFGRVQHAVFPRIAAVAETGWSPQSRKDYADFLRRLPMQLQRYDALGIAYAQTPFEVSFDVQDGADGGYRIALSNSLGYTDIRYTTDGSDPGPQATRYQDPLQLNAPVQLRAAVFESNRRLAHKDSTLSLDAASRYTRTDEALKMCTQSLMLRLEDDGPLEGDRAIFNADIFNPCWLWEGAPVQDVAKVEVRAGQLPYYFQLAHDESHRKFQPARSAHGELDISAGCEGPRLASVPLPEKPGPDGFITLSAELPPQTKATDLCLRFTGDTRPTMWVLDQVTLQPTSSR